MAKIGFNDVEVRTFGPLPKGRYMCKLSAAEFVPESKRSGEPAIAWEYTVVGGDYDKRKGFLNTSLQPLSLWSTQRVLMSLGMSKEDVDNLDWDTDDPDTIQSTINDLIDTECVLVIRQEKYEGEDRQRVARVLPATETSGVSNVEGAAPSGGKAKF